VTALNYSQENNQIPIGPDTIQQLYESHAQI